MPPDTEENKNEIPETPSEPLTETPIETPSVIPETELKVPEEPAIVDVDKVIVEDRKEESEPPKPVEEKPVSVTTPPPEPTTEPVEVAKPNVESPMSNDVQTPQTSSEVSVGNPTQSSTEVSVGNPTQSSTEVSVGKHDPRFTKDIPQKVLELTDEEIDAARKLWAREHLDQARAKANENRKVHMIQMMEEIEKFVKTNPGTSVHTIANSVRLSEKLTSGYLEKLVKAKRVKASGNTRNRRYS